MGKMVGDLGALSGEETRIRLYYMKQNYFQLKKNRGKETKNGVSLAATKV